MNFLVDAHLSRRLCRVLESYGHTAIHTLDLPQQNKMEDRDIMQYADANDCIVTTKDADFVDVFIFSRRRVSSGSFQQAISVTLT